MPSCSQRRKMARGRRKRLRSARFKKVADSETKGGETDHLQTLRNDIDVDQQKPKGRGGKKKKRREERKKKNKNRWIVHRGPAAKAENKRRSDRFRSSGRRPWTSTSPFPLQEKHGADEIKEEKPEKTLISRLFSELASAVLQLNRQKESTAI